MLLMALVLGVAVDAPGEEEDIIWDAPLRIPPDFIVSEVESELRLSM